MMKLLMLILFGLWLYLARILKALDLKFAGFDTNLLPNFGLPHPCFIRHIDFGPLSESPVLNWRDEINLQKTLDEFPGPRTVVLTGPKNYSTAGTPNLFLLKFLKCFIVIAHAPKNVVQTGAEQTEKLVELMYYKKGRFTKGHIFPDFFLFFKKGHDVKIGVLETEKKEFQKSFHSPGYDFLPDSFSFSDEQKDVLEELIVPIFVVWYHQPDTEVPQGRSPEFYQFFK